MFISTHQIEPQTQAPLYQDESDLCEPGVGYFWKGLLEVVLYLKKSSLIWFSIYFALRLKGEGFSPLQCYIWAKRKRKAFSDDDTITECSVGIVLGCRLACGTGNVDREKRRRFPTGAFWSGGWLFSSGSLYDASSWEYLGSLLFSVSEFASWKTNEVLLLQLLMWFQPKGGIFFCCLLRWAESFCFCLNHPRSKIKHLRD